ncbi:MAG: SusC/RagA family TonB-linked outer membrane protein [Saprospiraceae bacterium]
MKKLCFFFLLFGLCRIAYAQERTITGLIADGAGEPLTGVSVRVPARSTQTSSDVNGHYSLKVFAGDVMEFSMLGMKPEKITVGASNEINVSMVADDRTFSDVVITAYGITKEKHKLGYSAQNLSGDDLSNTGESNLVNTLNGKLAGVFITPSGGGAGAASNIVIRGYSSISGNNQPLFVVDGVPISNQTDPSSAGGNPSDYRDAYIIYRGTNRAIDINQYDIESIAVLKGGAATALYGSRANNGVILIKTKSGRKGFDVSLNSTVEFSQVNKTPGIQHKFTQGSGGVFNASSYKKFGPAYADNPTFPAGTVIDLNTDGTLEDVSGQRIPNYTGYYDDFWRTGVSTKNSLNFSAGNNKGSLFAGFTNVDDHSIVPEDAYQRRSLLLKGDYNLTDKLTVGISSNYIGTDLVAFPTGYRSPAYALSSIANSVYDIDGPWKDSQGKTTFYSKSNNKTTPVWIVNEEAENIHVDRLIGNVSLGYKLARNLVLSYKLGIDNFNEKRKRVRPIGSPFKLLGDIHDMYANSRDVNSDLILSGSKRFLDDQFSINFLVGNNVFEQHFDRSFIYGQSLNLNNFDDISNAKLVSVTNSIKRKRIIGAFGELGFGYQDYLFLELSARNDWSSTLPEDNNSYLYPSASVGFVFTKFLKMDWLNSGKIRASFAQIGNDAPIYATTNTYYLEKIVAGQSGFSVVNESKNPNLKPEISNSSEFGLDLTFLDELFNLNLTYYKRITKDQIAQASLPGSTGYASYILNAGVIENKGLEASLSTSNLLKNKRNWSWDASVNFTKNKNEVLEIPAGLNEVVIGQSSWFGANIIVKPGLPYGTVSGSYYERDAQNKLLIGDDGYPIQASDRKALGDPNPDWTMNFTNRLGYKNWRLSFLFDIKQGGQLFNESRLSMWYYGSDIDIEQLGTTRVFDGIVKSTGVANTKEVVLDETYFESKRSFIDEPAIEDASWVRLRNISLSCQLNPKWLERTFIKQIVMTASGRNLWLSTPYSGIDPESASALGPGNVQVIDMFAVPGTKSYSFSLKMNF